MARIKLDLPDFYHFKSHLTVRITDINYGGHTGNDVILKFMHEARMNFLRSLGIKDEISIRNAVGLIVADAAIEYKAETFYADKLSIALTVDEFHKYGFEIYYHLFNEQQQEIAKGKTGILFFDYSKRKLATAPEELILKIKSLPRINK